MNNKDRIATYYSNARELVKQKHPRAARAYLLEVLNAALETYHAAKTILLKAKTAAFLERWIAVSRDLYDVGITDYVLECFGLRDKAAGKQEAQPQPSAPQNNAEAPAKKEPSEQDDAIDIEGLVEEETSTQGWCADVFEANKTAVVEISVSSAGQLVSGTGFIISKNGYLLTNDHVVFDEGSGVYYPKVTMSFVGEKKKYKIEVLFSDKKHDVALCRFDPNEVQSFTSVKRIADYQTVKQGADCLVIGNAFGMGLAPFTGIIRFTKKDGGDMVYTAPSNPGDSGGPVFNRRGECIGINKSKTVKVNNTVADAYTNATPMDAIDALLKKWTANNNIEL